ncbi:RDD family protein [Luteimonas sp. e5]
MEQQQMEYVGFWPRVVASVVDALLMGIIIYPPLTLIYGADYWSSNALVHGPADFLLSWVLPAIAVVWFWVAKGATPGKMVIGARIVDAATGKDISLGKAAARYLGYFPSAIVLFLGCIWVGFDARKQGWHDHIAGTVVIRNKNRGPQPVRFEG